MIAVAANARPDFVYLNSNFLFENEASIDASFFL